MAEEVGSLKNIMEVEGGRVGGVSLGRHQAQCTICQHPQRQEIEEKWIDWCSPYQFQKEYGISHDSMYRHAHALDLFSKRNKNATRALERIIEKVDYAQFNGSVVVSAIKALAKINSTGQRSEQAQSTNAKELFQRMSPQEREAFAQDGSLPDWFSGGIGATPSDGQEGEKEREVTENTLLQ
jgi:hypothetical protein